MIKSLHCTTIQLDPTLRLNFGFFSEASSNSGEKTMAGLVFVDIPPFSRLKYIVRYAYVHV